MNPFALLGLVFVLAVGYVGLVILLSLILSPRSRGGEAKAEPYESGVIPRMSADARLPVRFYRVALLFLIFDVEIAFLYPWAVQAKELGVTGAVEIALFVGMLFVAYLYYWKRGGLQWE